MLNQLPVNSSESATMEIFNERLLIFSDELQIDGDVWPNGRFTMPSSRQCGTLKRMPRGATQFG